MPNLIGTNANQVSTNGMLGTAAFTDISAVMEWTTGVAIASAATINLDTATGNRVHITGVATITAVTLTRGPRTVIFDGVLTLTHNATANNLPGAANITTAAGDRAIYESDGTTVYCVSYIRASGAGVVSASVGDHAVIVHTGNGNGSTNSRVRRFTTTLTNVGTAITYADSATLGASFTINETGFYSMYYQDVGSQGAWVIAISLNAVTDPSTLAVASRIASAYSSAAGIGVSCSRVELLTAGSVIRANNGANTDVSNFVHFAIRKVGV